MEGKHTSHRKLTTKILAGLVIASMLGSSFLTVYAGEASDSAVSEAAVQENPTEEISMPDEEAGAVKSTAVIESAGEESFQEESGTEDSAAESSETENPATVSTDTEETAVSTETIQAADVSEASTEETTAASTESAVEEADIEVTVEESAEEQVSFAETKTLDGVAITVTADPGVFPDGSTLEISRAGQAEADKAESAVDEERSGDVTVATSYVFDISVRNENGDEIEPDTDAGKVTASFSAAEVSDRNLDTTVYHITEKESGLSASALDTTIVFGNTVEAETDSFSLYVVEFTYGNLSYTLNGDETAALQDILDAVGLKGAASDAQSSNPDLFTVTKDDAGAFTVTAVKAFDTAETLAVTISGMAYQIAVTDAAVDQDETTVSSTDYNTQTPDAPTWTYSKSIRATNLAQDENGNYLSDVTISLPAAQEPLITEVCFVLDKSQFSATREPALQLLDELKSAITNNGAKVQIDIVGFNRAAFSYGPYDLMTEYDDIVQAFEADVHGGTNMHAGLLKAEEILERDSSIPDSRKFMILVSDGDTYLYCKNGDYKTPYSRSYGNNAYGGYYDENLYCPSNQEGNVNRPGRVDTSQSAWEEYLEDVEARNQESNGDQYDFVWKYYEDDWPHKTLDEVLADGLKIQPAVPRSASNMDMAFLNAASVYHDLAAKYHCYSEAAESTALQGHPGFMGYLNNGASSGFDNIKNEILYFLDTGSTVTETIGYTDDYNFDLFNPDQMAITVDNTNDGESVTYPAREIAENHYGFGQLQDGTYRYEVTYTPGEEDSEQFVWKINVPVTNFMHVSLKYQVKLMNPKTAPGVYGEYDEYGENHKTSLYVSNRAVLNPVTSDGTEGQEEEFLKPTVSYTVQKNSDSEGNANGGGPGAVNLCKVDGQTGAALEGASFALYQYDGTYVGTYTTGKNGCINVSYLNYGSYYFTETKAPEGYTKDPTHIVFELNEETSILPQYPWNIKFSNTKAGSATVMVGGTKIWDDSDNAAGARPDAVTLHLFANGTEVGTAAATRKSGWTYSFGAQAAVDENGNEIQYTVTEDPVADYTASISAAETADGRVVINVTNTYSKEAAVAIATGDESRTGVYLALMLIAAAGFAGSVLYRKKRRR